MFNTNVDSWSQFGKAFFWTIVIVLWLGILLSPFYMFAWGFYD